MICGMNCKEIIIFLVLFYQPKKNSLSAYGDSDTCSIWKNTAGSYLNLLTSGRLNAYLADIDKQTEEMFFRLVEQMKQAQGIMEQLKAENALEWTGRLNNIRACAREIVERKIIFA